MIYFTTPNMVYCITKVVLVIKLIENNIILILTNYVNNYQLKNIISSTLLFLLHEYLQHVSQCLKLEWLKGSATYSK